MTRHVYTCSDRKTHSSNSYRATDREAYCFNRDKKQYFRERSLFTGTWQVQAASSHLYPETEATSPGPAPLPSTMDKTDVEQVTLALLDAATDKDSVVQEQVRKSILTLGKQHPDRVLAMCQDYLLKHPKLVVSHRVVILRTIELIVGCRIEEISYPKIKSIISLASDEMTRSKEVIPDWQQAASNILVAVGNKHINDIMEEILSKFQPGLLPHFFVVQTLANLSDSNVYGMVPFLNAILGTMLPMLSMAKQDNMKWVFSSALCHFSDSILEYLANLDKAPDPTVRKDTFSSEIYAAFDILFNNWLQSRESKLRLTVAEAVGSMCHLMASDKLEEQIPKLIPAILSLYKKNTEHYVISKSLCQMLDASVSMGSRVLETQLDSLLFALHQQVSAPVDYSNPPTVKNHNEVLRCFSLLANSFPDRLVMFVLQKLENSNERSRMGSLAVLRHLINSSTSTMESKKLLILASIRQPMADHGNKVKKHVVQVISAMAHHGYLELEGGELLVRFIVQHCALPDTYRRVQKPTDPEEVTNEALRTMCDNTLHLLTTTVGRLADVLWPKLLYYLTPSQYSNATTPLCKSLIVLGNKKKSNQEPSFNIDFTQEVNLPSPQTLMVRLLVNAAFPFSSRGHGAPSLSLLLILSVNIHPNTEIIWEKEIPPLLSMLEESTAETLDKKHWDEKLLKLLSKTLATIDDDKWVCQLAVEATTYLSTYSNALEEKSFLYRCVGVTLQQCFNKELVKKQLQEILLTARHNDAVEREGVAMSVGLCANSHLEGTLAKLEEFGKSDAFKKSPSIFNLLKERNDVEVEKVKSTLILCYGQVALNAPPEKILTRIDQDILRCISKHFNTKVLGIKVETKDLTMKLSLIQSVGLIARAISECVKKQGFIFSRKQELITLMLDFIKAEAADSLRTPVRHLVMTTCANLIPLEPALSESESFDLLKVCVSSVFSLPPETHSPEKTKEEETLNPKQRKALYKDTMAALQDLLKSVLAKDPTPDGLQSVFKHIESWLSSGQDHERERAVTATAHMLTYYLDNLTVKNMVSFHNLGALLGRLTPRCTDPHPTVRTSAVDCIYSLLYIQLRYEGFALNYKDEGVDSLLRLKERLDNPDHTVLYKTCSELTKVMSKRLPQQQLATLVFMLFEGLVDSQTNCCRASSVILNTLLKNRGGGLQELVPEMLEVLHVRMQSITEEQVRVAVGQTVLILASQHLQTVINTLVNQPLPYDSWTSEMWMALGADAIVANQIIEMVIEKLLIMAPYVDQRESMIRGGTTKVATNQPLAMTWGLKELLLNGQSQEPAVSLFPQLFSCLTVRLGASVGVSAPKDNSTKHTAAVHVAGVAAEALRILLARAKLDEVIKRMDEDKAWDAMKEANTHVTGITLLARAMAKHAGPRLPAIVECMCPSLNNIYECQRITVTAFFSELLNHHVVTELMLIDVLMNNMMERISDPCCTVRMLAVRGLGNIAVGSPEKVNKYAKELLAAMSSGMEEKEDPGKLIALEAMSGLSKVLLYLDKKNVHLLVVYIFMKIKPFLESENDEIRCASIHLMGNLSKFGSGEPVFKDQIHNVLVSLLLHLVDPNPQVVKACKYSMRVCAPVVGSEQITAMFQNHLLDDKSLHYGEFINDLTKYLIQDFPGMLNFYHISVIQFFKSHWAEVRAGAAMFIGFLLGNLPEEHFSHLNMGTITKGLVMLLQDPDPVVRVKAAEAMGRFH
ncbi:maestro heat-like repeat-containing protein family member 1 isoform X1 [Etheostoma cragini]|uniref:maestro heat-like repeat-containing protein family member 1 isoform X1 n=2 Tax=Etheostoma cragini TaxID=417921 RepID=UPI00155E169D|nr:maestro heat-like repeat-containing protein family member 1 isoform X1 [Etheostoma cragini]